MKENHFRLIRNRAFTLVELLLVLVILAVLAAVVVPKFTKRSEQARIAPYDIESAGTAEQEAPPARSLSFQNFLS